MSSANAATAEPSANLSGVDSFKRELDQLRDQLKGHTRLEQIVVASTIAATSGLTVGYVIWLIRGGILIGSLLSSLPAWRLIDPLPVLARLVGEGRNDEDEESLESLLKRAGAASGDASAAGGTAGTELHRYRTLSARAEGDRGSLIVPRALSP